MFGSLGGPEVVLILVIALIVFGPRRLPEIGKTMGKMLAEFRKASNDFKRTIEDEVEAERTKESQTATSLPAAPAETGGATPPTVTTIDPAAYGYGAGESPESGATPAPAATEADASSPAGAEPPAAAPGAPEPEGTPPVAVGAASEPPSESPAEPTVSRGRAADEK